MAGNGCFWLRHEGAGDALVLKLARGRSLGECALELTAEYGEEVSRGMVAVRVRKVGRPALLPGFERTRLQSPGRRSRVSWFWDDHPAASEVLAELAKLGQSATQIAARLAGLTHEAVTRNAVISKARRLGVHLVGVPHGSTNGATRPLGAFRVSAAPRVKSERLKIPHYTKVNARPRLKGPRQPPQTFPERPPPSGAPPVALVDLRLSHCRWIVQGDPSVDVSEVRYCGEEWAYEGCSWCSYHRSIAVVPPRASAQPAPRDGRYGR